MNIDEIIINLQQQVAYLERKSLRNTSAGIKRSRTKRMATISRAVEILEATQNFADMIADHSDEIWTGEEILDVLEINGIYENKR